MRFVDLYDFEEADGLLLIDLIEEEGLEVELLKEAVILVEPLIVVEVGVFVENLSLGAENGIDTSCSVLMGCSNFVNSDSSLDCGSTKMDARRSSRSFKRWGGGRASRFGL